MSTYICPSCDAVHLVVVSETGSVYGFSFDQHQAEELGRRLFDPQPVEHVELT
jgi:hypothetical protein